MSTLGFIGLGVMGEPMCRNLAARSGQPVIGFDVVPEPLERLRANGVETVRSIGALAERADILFLSLPSGREVDAVCSGPHGFLERARPGQVLVDLGTSPIALARSLAERCAARGALFADAPVARTREAAVAGTLSIMVGGTLATFERIRPLLACMASEITHCGDPGAGQLAKIMNNLVLAQTVAALAEALAIARRAGVDDRRFMETLAKGSADSFALRNHGMKAMLPADYPERAFSAAYMLKDVDYAIEAARELGMELGGALRVRALLEQAVAAGRGGEYWPVICEFVARAEAGSK